MDEIGNAGTMVLDLFEELGNVLEYLRSGGDTTALQPKSAAAIQFISYYVNGQTIEEAFFLVCADPSTQVGRILFGSITPSYDERAMELTARDCGHSLNVVLCATMETTKPPPVRAAATIVLYTDFKSFTLRRVGDPGQVTKPFAVFNAREMCDDIAFTGSVWASVYPTHFAIVTRTISHTFAQGIAGALFSNKAGVVSADDVLVEEQSAYSRLACLDSVCTQILSLDALRVEMESCYKPPRLLSQKKEGSYTLRRYSPQRCSLFDFGEPAIGFDRADFVTTYNVGPKEFHRDFFMSPRTWAPHERELQLAAFDILHMLAIRRTSLFRLGFASRAYNVLLPPVVLRNKGESPNSYVVFPCLHLYRIGKRGGFRRTISVTFIACPVLVLQDPDRQTEINSRPAPLEELYQLKDDLLSQNVDPGESDSKRRYMTSGPLQSYLRLPFECTIPELLRHISKSVLHEILARGNYNDRTIERVVNSALFVKDREARMATLLLQVEWALPDGFTQPWERWLALGDDKAFCKLLFRTIFFRDYHDPYFANSSYHAVPLSELNIGNTLGADMTGMTLYNPRESMKVILFPRALERYPNYSLVRWMAWHIYIDTALASLRALIEKFHSILDDRTDLPSIIETLNEMIREFVDFYDLDLTNHFYRKEYEKLRKFLYIDSDYLNLMSRFTSSKEDASLREQQLINKLIVALTLATVTVTVISTIAANDKWSALRYSTIGLGLSAIMICVGYILFDPIRRGLDRLYRFISRFWR